MIYKKLELGENSPPKARVWIGESWLAGKETRDGWGLGCIACADPHRDSGAARKLYGPYTSFEVQAKDSRVLYKFLKHQESLSHKRQVVKYLGLSLGGGGIVLDLAPPVEEFKEAWEAVRNGSSIRSGVKDRCGETKLSFLIRCLAEAMWAKDRSFVAKAMCMGLHRDERRGRLLVRYRAVQEDLSIRTGIFGQLRSKPGAVGIANSTVQMVQHFCTSRPQHRLKNKCTPDPICREALDHIVNITEAITVDSAEDELLASRLASQGSRDEFQAFFKHQRTTIRDTTHGSRKIIERSVKADEFLQELIKTFMFRKGSITQVIQNSPDHSREFESAVRARGGSIKNLRGAKHRFESYATPSWRFSAHFDSLCHVASNILAVRKDPDLLTYVDTFFRSADVEARLNMAAVADFSQDCLQFTRWLDDEQVESSELQVACAGLAKKLVVLYQQGKFIEVGCTAAVIKDLKSVRLFTLRDGSVISVGGPNQPTRGLLTKCEERMKCVATLALQILRTEFPSYDLLAAFSVFGIGGSRKKSSGDRDLSKENERQLEKLAAFCEVDAADLKSEYLEIYPIAERAFKDHSCTVKEAWRLAIQRMYETIQSPIHEIPFKKLILTYM